MRAHETDSDKTETWIKSGECLYRYKPSGTYYARIQHVGKEIRRSLKTRHLAEAKRKLLDFRRDLERVDPALHKLSLEQCATRWLQTQTHLQPSTIKLKKDIIARIRREWPDGAKGRVTSVKKTDVQLWLSQCEVSPSTYNTYLEAIRGVLQFAVDSQVIPRNPARDINRLERGTPVRLVPSYPDFLRIVADLRSQSSNGHGADESADLVLFMGEQGVGQAEVRGLQRQHVDIEQCTIHFLRKKTNNAYDVPIMPNIRQMLKCRLENIEPEPTTRVFRHADPKKGLEGACRRLGLPIYSPRALRRLFVTRALRAGIDVKTIAVWQGHKDGGKLILKTYSAEVDAVHSAKMAEKMAVKN